MIDPKTVAAELGVLADHGGLADDAIELARDLQALVDAGLVRDIPGLEDTRMAACDDAPTDAADAAD